MQQFYKVVIAIPGQLPFTVQTNFRSYYRAVGLAESAVRDGYSACLCTMNEEGLLQVEEFNR